MTMSIFEYIVILTYFCMLLWMLWSQRDKITELEKLIHDTRNSLIDTPNYKEYIALRDRFDALTKYLEVDVTNVPQHIEVKDRVNS